ncbi:hypothetical protein GCM10009737_33840 [Nocardioides lentus]|uniref:Glycosyltransferase family 1 protein n=1 Tax=Nocardioides lentus TaxID=338077 RepID=A0ABP5B3C0_9ACTN
MTPPVHVLVAGTERHGVTLLAGQVARAAGAATTTHLDLPAPGTPVHVHFTDRLYGGTPEAAAAALVRLAARHPTTVTLHDVPQPSDGEWFARRRDSYAAVLAAARGWVTSSETERATVAAHCAPRTVGGVVPLPIVPAPPAPVDGPRERSVAVFGWVYPGKGHVEALEAAALLGDTPEQRPAVRALGSVAAGHDDLLAELAARADGLGVRFSTTGWLDDVEAARRMLVAGVGLVAHANLSASGSLNSWVALGRRPLVRAGDYTREMARLRPGTLDLYDADDGVASLAARVAARLDGPPDVLGPPPRPHLDDTAAAYRAWWEAQTGQDDRDDRDDRPAPGSAP